MKIILFFILSSVASARSYLPQEISQMAVDRAPYIKMYVENQAASENSIKQAKLLSNPIFTLQTGRLKTGTQNGAVVDVTLNQPLPWPGKREALIHSQELLAKVAEVDLEEAKMFIAHQVNLLSFQAALNEELEKHHAERKKRFSLIHRYLTSRPLASPKQQIDRDMIENQIRLFEKLMREVSARKEGSLQELTLWTGQKDLAIQMDWSKLPKIPERSKYEQEFELSPRYRRSQNTQRLAHNRVEEAKYLAKPDIFVGANYRQENVRPTNHFYHVQVGIALPIIDRGQHSIETARAFERREEAMKELTMLQMKGELNMTYPMLQASFESMALYPVSEIHRLEKSFKRAEDAFMKGQIDVVSFIQTDTQLHDYVDQAYTSRINYLSTLSQLEMLVGKKLEL